MKRRQKDGKEIDIKDMETSHIKNCIKAIKEGRIMKDYIDGTYGSTAEECDAWYVDRSGDRKKVLDEFDKELNRREMVELEEENKKLKDKLSEVTMVADDEKQSIEYILELEEEIRSLELEKRNWEVESEELKMWLREKLPLALLKEYMNKFEGVDLKNV